jgi:DME family drug/metabolite transporter
VSAAPTPAPLPIAGLLKVALAASTWGTWSLFLRPSGLPGEATAPLVLLLIGVFTLPLVLREAQPHAWDRRALLLLAANTALDAVNVATFFLAMSRTTVAIAVLTHYLAPVFVALASPLVDRQRVAAALPAALLSLVGLLLLLAPWRSGALTPEAWLGAGLGALSAVAYAGNVFVVRRIAERLGAARAQAYHCLLAGLCVAPLALTVSWPTTPAPATLGLVALGALLPGTVAGLLFVSGLRAVGAARASVLAYLEPLVAVGVGWAVWGEPLDEYALVGAGLVIVGGLLVARSPVTPITA